MVSSFSAASPSRVGLGCMRLSTDPDRDEARALLTIAAARPPPAPRAAGLPASVGLSNVGRHEIEEALAITPAVERALGTRPRTPRARCDGERTPKAASR